MRVLFWYCDHFSWDPAIKTIEDAPDAEADEYEKVIVAFVHVEPKDVDNGNTSETKLVKNAKWLARKWDITKIVLHSFTHLGEEKAEAYKAQELLHRAQDRLENAGYTTVKHHTDIFWIFQLRQKDTLLLVFIRSLNKNISGDRKMLEIKVHDIKGICPVHKVGDRIIIQNPEIKIEETDALCTHALPTILHYVLILEYNWCPFQLGLTKKDDQNNAYIQCLDPGQPYTDGGTVIFRIRVVK